MHFPSNLFVHVTGSSATGPTEPGSKLGQQLANILFSQAKTFLQQVTGQLNL